VASQAIDSFEAADRAFSELADQVSRQDQLGRASRVVDLVVGSNRIVHQLGRTPTGASITPTVADATYAWAVTAKDERTITIQVIGAAQPQATIEVF
jgi:hypothetical protein